ncbi:MAG: Flp pilus assembly protein CpaB [Paraclostridium sp.]
MAIKKNRTTLGIVSIVVGGVLCFGVAPIYNKSMQKGVEVIRVSSEIQRGEKITPNKVKVVETSKKGLAESTILKKEDVIGKYAVVDMVRDNTILERQVSNNPVAEDKYLYGLSGEKQVISFTIPNFASGLSGKLITGDIISIIATSQDEENNDKTYTPEELKYVKVLAVTNDIGKDKKDDSNLEDGELPTTITVLASKKQAELIANLEETSKMHVSLVYRGTDEEAQKYIDIQDGIQRDL